MITEQLYWRKIICRCFHLIRLWLFLSTMKRGAKRCALQLYNTSLRSSFFRTVIFSQLFFQNSFFFRVKILQSSHSLRIGSYLRRLFFGTTIFLAEELFRIKISKEELLFQSRNFCTAWTFSGKLHFGKSWYFGKTIIRITYFFRRAAILHFTSIHSYTSYLFVSIKWAVVNVQFKFDSSFLCIYCCSKWHPRYLNKVSWLNRVLWSCYFLMKLVFSEPLFLKDPYFFQKVIYVFAIAIFPDDAVFYSS